MKTNIIIIGSNPATRLGLIRSVVKAVDCSITVINLVHNLPEVRKVPVDCASKFVSKFLLAEKYNSEFLCQTLLENCLIPEAKSVILSVDDDSVNMIDSVRDRLQPYFVCAGIRNVQGGISRMMDKRVQKQLADQYGMAVARCWTAVFLDGSYAIPENVVYPCYLKGQNSFNSLKDFQGKCNDRLELEARLKRVAGSFECPMLIEEYLPIEKELGVIGYCDGENCCIPSVVELMEGGQGGHKGVSAYCEVLGTEGYEDVVQSISRLVSDLGYFGLFNVDLAVSGGKLYFVEMNLRYAAYGFAVDGAGVNLPGLFVRTALQLETFDMNRTIQRHCSYMNEKVAFDDFVAGYKSFADVRRLRRNADIHLIENNLDPAPYRLFRRRVAVNYLKQRVKSAIHK